MHNMHSSFQHQPLILPPWRVCPWWENEGLMLKAGMYIIHDNVGIFFMILQD